MSASTIITSTVTGGSNSHATTAEEANATNTDFITPGVVGAISLNVGSGGTGSFCVNADASPDMGITIKAGQAYVTATPSGQNSQVLRVRASTDYTAYTINANASGSTKYDWIYLKIDATKANNPASDASDVASIVTSRSSSNTADNGTPPTYGLLLAIVTVANGASSITNSNISDQRTAALIGSANTSLNTYQSENTFDHVASGLVWTADSAGSTLNGSMTAGVVYINGIRNTVAAVSAHAFAASLDTYIDVLYSSTGVGTLVYTTASNNAASPALAANSVRIGIVVTGGTSIASAASINQGQETKVLPIASSIPYAVTDSLGNLICPRDPNRKTLGYRQITSSFVTNTAGSDVDVTGLNLTVNVPTGRKIKLTGFASNVGQGGTTTLELHLVEGSTVLGNAFYKSSATITDCFLEPLAVTTPSAGTHTYKITVKASAGTGTSVGASATSPAFLLCELI